MVVPVTRRQTRLSHSSKIPLTVHALAKAFARVGDEGTLSEPDEMQLVHAVFLLDLRTRLTHRAARRRRR